MTSTKPVNIRSAPQRSELTGNNYLALNDFEDVGWMDGIQFYADVPWIQRDSQEDTEFLRRYAGIYGWLPGKIPLEVTENAV